MHLKKVSISAIVYCISAAIFSVDVCAEDWIQKEFEVAGYVTNLTDCRVCIEAAGDETEVLDFKREIENRMQAFIRKVELRTQSCPLRFSGFIIR